MTLPASNAIALSNLNIELSGGYPLSNYYLGEIFQRNYEYYVNLFEKYSSLLY